MQEIVFKLNESMQWYKVVANPSKLSQVQLPDGRVIQPVLSGLTAGYDRTNSLEVRCGFILVKNTSKVGELIKAEYIATPSLAFVEKVEDKPQQIVFEFENCWYEVQAVCGVFR